MNTILQDKIISQTGIWQTNRRIYPGWLIAPRKVRKQLWRYTENWVNPIAELTAEFSTETKLWVFFELNWRLEKCLLPLFSNLALAVESTITECDPTQLHTVGISGGRAVTFAANEVPDLAECWLQLSFGILRYYREERRRDDFTKWYQVIRHSTFARRDDIARLCYECSLFGLAEIDDSAVAAALDEWPDDTSDPVWLLRNAAMNAEIGNVLVAERKAEQVLATLRSGSILRPDDISSLSYEAWAMILLKMIDEQKKWTVGRNIAVAYRGRWSRFSQFDCDPWAEIREFHGLLDRPPPKPTPPLQTLIDFQPDKTSTIRYLGDNFFPKIAPAYEFTRFIEEAPCVPRIGNVTLYVDSARNIAKWFASTDPARTQSMVCRLLDEKSVDAYFSRHRVAALPESQIKQFLTSAKAALTDSQRVAGSHIGRTFQPLILRAQARLATSIEILARVAVRLSVEELSELWKLALNLYSSPMVAFGHNLVGPTANFFKSVCISLPKTELQTRFREAIEIPIAGSKGFEVWNDFTWPDLFLEVANRIEAFSEKHKSENWAGIVARLLDIATTENKRVRDLAFLRLSILYRLGCMTSSESNKFADVLWQHRDSHGLPESDVLFNYACLRLPEPEPGAAEQVFREYALSTQLGPVEPGMIEPNNLLYDWIGATLPLNGVRETKRRYIDWSIEDIKVLLANIRSWWENSGRSQISVASKTNPFIFGHTPLLSRISVILDVLRFVVIPRIAKGSGLAENVSRLVREFKEHRLPVGAVAPAMQTIDDHTDAAGELRIALASHDQNTYISALFGLTYWVEFQAPIISTNLNYCLPLLPLDLLRELGFVVANRRQPYLIQALNAVVFILNNSTGEIDGLFRQSILSALEYLYGETEYQLSDSGEGRISYIEVPKYRVATVEIANALAHKSVDEDIVRKWLESARNDPLPEVRHAAEH